MNLTPDERDLMTRVVLGESSDDPTERAGVAWNVLNRVGQPQYANNIHDVVLQRGAYNSVDDPKGPFYRSSRSAYADARNVVDGVAAGKIPDPTGGAPNFLAASMPPEKRPQWAQGEGQKIGKTIFYGGKPSMSADEADQYFSNRQAQPSAPATMSTDEADQWLEQHRAQQTPPAQQASSEPPTTETPASGEAQESYPSGVGLSTLFHNLPQPLQDTIRAHPYMSGAVAAGAIPLAIAALPEEAIGAGLGVLGRYAVGPAVRGASYAAGLGGLGDLLTGGKVHEMLPKVIDMISRLGDEGAH